MDETTEGVEARQGEEAEEPSVEADEECECGPEKRRRGGFGAGILMGGLVGGTLALLLAPLKGETGASKAVSGEGGERRRAQMEEEGLLRAQVAKERMSSMAGGIVAGAQGAWRTLRERLSDAWTEGKEGMAEGQEQARRKHFMMARRGHHRAR